MKAYKVFRVEDGRLFSALVRDQACIEYYPGLPSMGQIFTYNGKRIRLPIIVFRDLGSAKRMKKKCEQTYFWASFEIWEVEGKYCHKKVCHGDIDELELGNYCPDELSFPDGTIFLETCTPIRRVDVS